MEKKPSTNRKAVQTRTNKKISTSLKRDKSVVKKSVNGDAVEKPPVNSGSSNTETARSDSQIITGVVRFIISSWSVIPLGLLVLFLLLSPIFLFIMQFFSSFLHDGTSVFMLSVAFFGMLGATLGWLWKRTRIFAFIGGIIGIALPFGYLFLLARMG